MPTRVRMLALMSVATSSVEAGRLTRERLIDAAITRLAESGPDASFDTIA